MKIALSPQQYFDLSGYPLVNGRLRVFLHDSQDPCPLFTLSGDVYSPATNPVILDNAGEIHDTLWFDATIVDVKVDQKIADGTYRQISQFEYGFVVPEAVNDTLTFGIAGLKVADPALGIVTVWGYDEHAVAPSRQYVWDADCTADADDGCIVESSLPGADGRWLLLWDDEKLPCTVYGIAPGNEANIAAFLSYPETVGTWSLRMPRIPRFLPGTYSSDTTFVTSKTLYFDRGAQFLSASFRCPKVIVDEAPGGYIADFTLGRQQEVAESSWFRTVSSFFRCGAQVLHQSGQNFFADRTVDRVIGISATGITGGALNALTFTGPGKLLFTGCEIGLNALSTDWKVQFSGMDISDRWFKDSNWDVGATSGHRQLASVNNCTFNACNFDNANVWVSWLAENAVTSVDLQGRTVNSIPASARFTYIANGSVGTLELARSARLDRLNVSSLEVDLNTAEVQLDDCVVNLDRANMKTLAVHRGTLVSNVNIDTQKTTFVAEDANLVFTGVGLTPSDPGNFSYYTSVQLDRCTITGGYVANNMLQVHGCTVNGVEFDAYPYRNYATGQNYLSLDFDGNRFSGTSFIYVVPGIRADMAQDMYEVNIDRFIVRNNRFDTDVSGLVMPFWAHDMEHRFIKGCVSDFGFRDNVCNPSWTVQAVYEGNTGNCPISYPLPQDQVTGGGTFPYVYNGTTYTYAWPSASQGPRVFCLPASPDDGGYNQAGTWIVAPYGKICTSYRAKCLDLTLGGDASFPVTALMPECAIDSSLPNDMFKVRFVCISTKAASGFQPLPAV